MGFDGTVGASVGEISAIAAAPALSMVLGSAAVSLGVPAERVQARLQNLSAGLLIGAVLTEIFPIMKEHFAPQPHELSLPDVVAAAVGFVLALALMYGLKAMDLAGEGGGEDAEDAKAERLPGIKVPNCSRVVPLADSDGDPSRAGVELPAEDRAEVDRVVSLGKADERERQQLMQAVARLQVDGAALAVVVESDPVDREALDKTVHSLGYLIDATRRTCRGAEPLNRQCTTQLRGLTLELLAHFQTFGSLDVGHLSVLDGQISSAASKLGQIHALTEKAAFRRWAPRAPAGKALVEEAPESGHRPASKVPWGLVLAIAIDASVDGMLIGLAGSVAFTGGLIMALACTVEMCFLGYSFACTIVSTVHQRCLIVAILAFPPAALLSVAVGASAIAGKLEGSPIFSGLIAFALVALLFLVMQELLIEAHEKDHRESWHVSVFIYVGLVVSVILDVAL